MSNMISSIDGMQPSSRHYTVHCVWFPSNWTASTDTTDLLS